MDYKRTMKERDNARSKGICRVTWIGLWVNLFLSVFKIAAGYLGNSRAVLADGVHSLSDLITDIAVLVGVKFWMAPPDPAHPYGYKRLESLISFSIGAILALAGLSIGYEALMRIGKPESEPVGSYLALFAALFSVVSKEILYRWTIKKGRELKSEAVEANAWDHRSDAISSIPIVIAVAVAMWFPAFAVVDLLGALLVACFILYAAGKICLSAAHVLVDGGVDASIYEKIKAFSLRTHGIKEIHDLRTRYVGQGLQIDMHAGIDATLTVEEGDSIAHALENSLYSHEATEYIGVEIFDALVHIDPWYSSESKPDEATMATVSHGQVIAPGQG